MLRSDAREIIVRILDVTAEIRTVVIVEQKTKTLPFNRFLNYNASRLWWRRVELFLKGILSVFHVDAVVAYGRVGIAPLDEGKWIEDHGTHWLGTIWYKSKAIMMEFILSPAQHPNLVLSRLVAEVPRSYADSQTW